MDLSDRPELAHLGDLIGSVHASAQDVPCLLIGAMARDLLVQFVHGIRPPRATEDIDLALAVENWNQFDEVRQRLLDSGSFSEMQGAAHQLKFEGHTRVDLVPFGGVERPDGTIAWPPDGDPEMSVLGFAEALQCADEILLPGNHRVSVISLPMLILVKLIAAYDRYQRRPGVDMADVLFILEHYLGCGNQDRLFNEESDLLEDPAFDYELAGAIMAGRDLAKDLSVSAARQHSAVHRLREILEPQLGAERPGLMLQQTPAHKLRQSAQLLECFLRGLQSSLT